METLTGLLAALAFKYEKGRFGSERINLFSNTKFAVPYHLPERYPNIGRNLPKLQGSSEIQHDFENLQQMNLGSRVTQRQICNSAISASTRSCDKNFFDLTVGFPKFSCL